MDGGFPADEIHHGSPEISSGAFHGTKGSQAGLAEPRQGTELITVPETEINPHPLPLGRGELPVPEKERRQTRPSGHDGEPVPGLRFGKRVSDRSQKIQDFSFFQVRQPARSLSQRNEENIQPFPGPVRGEIMNGHRPSQAEFGAGAHRKHDERAGARGGEKTRNAKRENVISAPQVRLTENFCGPFPGRRPGQIRRPPDRPKPSRATSQNASHRIFREILLWPACLSWKRIGISVIRWPRR